MELNDAEREQLVALKLRHAYNRTTADEAIQVSDMQDGELTERDATFIESWQPISRALDEMAAAQRSPEVESENQSATVEEDHATGTA